MNLQGHIELGSIESVEPYVDKGKRKSCFKIVTPARTFVISANSDEDMESWMDSIKKMKDRMAQGNHHINSILTHL